MAKKSAPAKKNGVKKLASKPVKSPKVKVAKAASKGPAGKQAKKSATPARQPAPKGKAAAKPVKVAAKGAAPKTPPQVSKKELKKALKEALLAKVQAAVPVPKPEKAAKGKKASGAAAAKGAEAQAVETPEAEIILTNADGKRYCKVGECDELATSDSYCRYHYLLNWKKIQLRKKILAGDKLNRYIEELTARYPDKYLEMIRKDLATDKDFMAALQELEIDEGSDENEFEDDSKTYIDEVRGTIPEQDDGDY